MELIMAMYQIFKVACFAGSFAFVIFAIHTIYNSRLLPQYWVPHLVYATGCLLLASICFMMGILTMAIVP
jgi:uncharacterized membrane protein